MHEISAPGEPGWFYPEPSEEGFEWLRHGFAEALTIPSSLVFNVSDFPSLVMAPGVGLITRDRNDRAAALDDRERTYLHESFRTAYIDSLLRGVPLVGVLGSDMVHGWLGSNPLSWVQNWRTSIPEDNSWGLPSLILAIRGTRAEQEAENRVFIVQGRLLDHYGRSAGINNANGVRGYGFPRGYEFLHDGKLAQRFDLGLITIDEEGRGSFRPENPRSKESEFLSESGMDLVGVFFHPAGIHDEAALEELRAAFLTAWMMALDRDIEPMIPDGPGHYITFTGGSWGFPGGEALEGIYVQSFNERRALLLLPDSPLLPPYPRLIVSPFIDLLFNPPRSFIPGEQNLRPLPINFDRRDDFSRIIMRGLTLYGIPLTDPMPVRNSAGTSWQEAQRFSRGWLVNPAIEPFVEPLVLE
jgi:hypothetical protein